MPGDSCLSVPARACDTDTSSWKSTYFQKIFRKKLQKDRCFRRINSQYEDKKLIKLNKSRRWYVDNDIGRSYKKKKWNFIFFFFSSFFLPSFFLLNLCFFYIFRFVEACIYIYDSWKLRTFHALIKKFVLFVFCRQNYLLRYPMMLLIRSLICLFFFSFIYLFIYFLFFPVPFLSSFPSFF